jgi:hypothetical protein
MAPIRVTAKPEGDGWRFDVEVRAGSTTTHCVTLARSDYEWLVGGKSCPPEELVRKSFDFLLERESNQSILRRFDLPLIARYFPEYETEIRGRM